MSIGRIGGINNRYIIARREMLERHVVEHARRDQVIAQLRKATQVRQVSIVRGKGGHVDILV
jgi:hypothetical protein